MDLVFGALGNQSCLCGGDKDKMRLVVAWVLVVVVGLITGARIGVILGFSSYSGAVPGAVVAIAIFAWRRRQEDGPLKPGGKGGMTTSFEARDRIR
jgi:hypothetical protein